MKYDYFKIKANETITDQFDNVRIIKDKEYSLISENEEDDNYTIIDEMGKVVVLSKRSFYYVEEQ